MRLGNIYLITNKINQKKYVGQTARDIDKRFDEHCSEKRGHSRLHNAIQKYGWQNFEISLIEQIPIEQMDEREQYWIKKLDTRNPEVGYNIAPGGKQNFNPYNKVEVLENGLIFDSKEEMGRMISQITSWSKGYITDSITECLTNNKTFLGYHLFIKPPETVPSDDDVLIDWIKTLNIKHQGKHVYCKELDLEFDTIAQAAKYLIDNNLYLTKSKTPIQSVTTSISKNIRGVSTGIQGTNGKLHFQEVPGVTTKQKGFPEKEKLFKRKKVYCSELNKTFESIIEAANYFIDNKIWTRITLKTAKIRISDVVRGAFPDYKGYTFREVE